MPKVLTQRRTARNNYREEATKLPDLKKLAEELDWSVNQRDANVWRRQQINYETRYNIWPGQSTDGRRWTPDREGNIWPWPGASDARVMLVDKYINEDVARDMTIWQRMKVTVTGNEAQDLEWGGRMTNYLCWLMYRQMKELRFEAELLANYVRERGAAIMAVNWVREQQLGYEEIDLEDVKTRAMQELKLRDQRRGTPQGELFIILPDLIRDPSREEEAVEAAKNLGLQHLTDGRIAKVVQDLRELGVARFPKPYIRKNRPEAIALALNEDVFLPPEATFDIQKSPAFDRIELLTETQLRERAASGWDRIWVEKVIETQRGRICDLHFSSHVRRSGRLNGLTDLNPKNLFEIVHAYRRRSNEDGVPGIYYTAYSRGVKDRCGYHDLLNYDHGDYPFNLFLREVRSRRVDDARGMGEVMHTLQMQIKSGWDNRIDRADIATLPPSFHPPGMPPGRWGPGAQLGTTRPKDYGFLDIPEHDLGSKEVEESVRRFADEYCGRPVDEQNTTQSQMMQQKGANDWMAGWVQVGTQILKLSQQFESEQFYYRVVGSEKGRSIRASREEIQGEFDLILGFDVSILDNKLVQEKIKLIRESLAMDKGGRIDEGEALKVSFEMIDPSLAERLIRPGADSIKAIRDDVRRDLVLMYQGTEPDYVENDPTAAMKLDLLNKEVFGDKMGKGGNPKYQEALQRDERFQELIQNYVKNLNQSVVQLGENIMAGKTGVKPVDS